MKTIFKILCFLVLMVPAFQFTIYVIGHDPFYTSLWLLICLVAGGFLKPLVDRLADRFFGKP